MGCGGERDKGPPERTARWEFINLEDFKTSSPLTVLAYAWLWFMAIVSVAVYAVDTFTAVNLLVFNSWSSQVKPYVPFEYSKWIFSMCIVVSWVLCFFEWIRAIRVIRRGGVAESYMDPLAVSLLSMRPGGGWKRFLVFKALTASKKRIDYTALFVYFAFKGAVRVIVAEGPRQVVNALTLYSVTQANLIVSGSPTDQASGIDQFFLNLKALADQNDRQTIILSSMAFTLLIWIFSALSLIAATILYLLFLWHYIPQRDARLSIYCRRKIDKRLEKIVQAKIQAGIDEENRRREKAERKAELKRQKTGELPPPSAPKISRQPTLPQLGDAEDPSTVDAKQASTWKERELGRQDSTSSVSSLPLYTGRSTNGQPLPRQPTLPDIHEDEPRPPMNYRSATQGSAWSNRSVESNAPLLANAGYAGGDGYPQTPAPTYYSRQGSYATQRPNGPSRAGTMTPGAAGAMARANTPGANPYASRNFTPQPYPADPSQPYGNSRPTPGQRCPVRTNTGTSFGNPAVAANWTSSPQEMSDGRDQSQSPYGLPTGTPAPLPRTQTPAAGTQTGATSGGLHGRQNSFSRPFGRRAPTPGAPIQQGMDVDDQQSPYAPSMPLRKATPGNPYLPRSLTLNSLDSQQQGQPTDPSESYEMTTQPSRTLSRKPVANPPPPSAYKAFSPYALSDDDASSIGEPATVTHSPIMAVSGGPGRENNYFGHVEEVVSPESTSPLLSLLPQQQQLAIPAASSLLSPPVSTEQHRLTTGYNDILDDYSNLTPGEQYNGETPPPPVVPEKDRAPVYQAWSRR